MRISTPFPSYPVTAGDLGLAVPAKIMRHIWAALKKLDTIVPGVLHPSTIMYYPEIKMYANKPVFLDRHFRVSGNVFMVGDGASTSRGITGGLGERHPGGGGYWAGTDSGRSCRADCGKYPKSSSSSYSRDTVCLSPTTVRSSSGRCGNAR